METYQSVLLERVENNESEMRKLETTAKRNLGNFTLGKKFAADIQQPQWNTGGKRNTQVKHQRNAEKEMEAIFLANILDYPRIVSVLPFISGQLWQ